MCKADAAQVVGHFCEYVAKKKSPSGYLRVSVQNTQLAKLYYHTDLLNRCASWMQKLMPFSTLTSEFVGDKL